MSTTSSSSPNPRLLARLNQESTNFHSDLPAAENYTFTPSPSNDTLHYTATFPGPPSTPYSAGLFTLSIAYPPTYPSSPPSITFKTKIYHPNIDPTTGYIGLNILHEAWSPVLKISKIILSLQALMSDPDPDEGVVMPEVAVEFLMRRGEFEERAREWTGRYAKGKGDEGE